MHAFIISICGGFADLSACSILSSSILCLSKAYKQGAWDIQVISIHGNCVAKHDVTLKSNPKKDIYLT